jgi:hypothetical protein
MLKALSYGARKKRSNTRPTYRIGVFYVVRAQAVARQQSARQWTGWVAITRKPQQTRKQQ